MRSNTIDAGAPPVVCIVNLGPTPFRSKSGLEIPGYGFRVVKEDGQIVQGRFRHSVVLDGQEIGF